MAKAAKKKATASKKSARVTAKSSKRTMAAKSKPKAAKKTAKKATAPRIDPLNRKQYTSLTPMLAVRDVRRAADFYANAFGFKVLGIMDGPDGQPVHAELRLRDTTLMLSPESPQGNPMGSRSASTIGDTPATLYILVENVDSTFNSAVAAGGKALMPVMDMFWGDRVGMIADLDSNKWMVATHKAEPTPAQMAEAMKQMMQSAHAAAAGSESEY